MNRKIVLTTVGVGVLALGLVAGAAAAGEFTATNDDLATGTVSADADGNRATSGRGGGYGGAGMSARAGQGAGQTARLRADRDDGDGTSYASGDLTDDQRDDLVFMVQEEKLAHDLYTALGAEYDVRTFTRIAGAETRHMDAVQNLLDTYGIDDPTVDLDAGEFVDADLASMYDTLLAQGMTSLDEAMAVGRTVEIDDIAALDEAADGVTAEDVLHVYAQLRAGSEKHLTAFGG